MGTCEDCDENEQPKKTKPKFVDWLWVFIGMILISTGIIFIAVFMISHIWEILLLAVIMFGVLILLVSFGRAKLGQTTLKVNMP